MNLVERIGELKRKRKAVLLAHYYQRAEVQDIADIVGDSLKLAIEAARTDAEVVVFCGVHFMAETAAITCPDRVVLLPDGNSGCPMADMCHPKELAELKNRYPDAVVVSYVNSSAAVKAQSDICCTSANAVKVMKSVPADRPVIFVPDRWLGQYAAERAGRSRLIWADSTRELAEREGEGAPVVLWDGYCHVHHHILPEFVREAMAKHPEAALCAHPECRDEVVRMARFAGSTGQILAWCSASEHREFLIATEEGILHPLRKANPDKTFHAVTSLAVCHDMKLITLEKILWALEDMEPRVTVEPGTAAGARKAIDAMLALSA